MSASATTLMFAIGLHRHQQAGAPYFRDYCQMAGELAAKFLTNEVQA